MAAQCCWQACLGGRKNPFALSQSHLLWAYDTEGVYPDMCRSLNLSHCARCSQSCLLIPGDGEEANHLQTAAATSSCQPWLVFPQDNHIHPLSKTNHCRKLVQRELVFRKAKADMTIMTRHRSSASALPYPTVCSVLP